MPNDVTFELDMNIDDEYDEKVEEAGEEAAPTESPLTNDVEPVAASDSGPKKRGRKKKVLQPLSSEASVPSSATQEGEAARRRTARTIVKVTPNHRHFEVPSKF